MTLQSNAILSATDISKQYRRGREATTALHQVSLDIYPGELIAIVGPSGSGKTTLSHIIGGLITPDTGKVVFDGKVLTKKSDKFISKYRSSYIGFIFQNFSLIPSYTAVENVIAPLIVAGVARNKRRKIAKEYLTVVGLEDRLNQRADTLSGGERQRVGIARALVNHPRIIIADEPTGNLDSVRGNEIMSILEHLSHTRGIAVVMVTHDLALAARADRMIHLKDGKITEPASV
jgi:putative ABC transport system ATP-binding protein